MMQFYLYVGASSPLSHCALELLSFPSNSLRIRVIVAPDDLLCTQESKGWFDSWKFLDDGLTWSCPLCESCMKVPVDGAMLRSPTGNRCRGKDDHHCSPPHRSVRAHLRIRLLGRISSVEACIGIRVQNTGWMNPPVRNICARHSDLQSPETGKVHQCPCKSSRNWASKIYTLIANPLRLSFIV